MSSGPHAIALEVNGERYDLLVDTNHTLLEVLRDKLALTGSKCGCGNGFCGSCTVLCENHPIRACLMLAVAADGRKITTIDSARPGDRLSVVQDAFVACGAVQCGFCTPGMVMATLALIESEPVPTTKLIHDALSGNLCRCTGYVKIVAAVELAARRLRDLETEARS